MMFLKSRLLHLHEFSNSSDTLGVTSEFWMKDFREMPPSANKSKRNEFFPNFL